MTETTPETPLAHPAVRRGIANQFLCVRKQRDEVQLSAMLAHMLTVHAPALRAFEAHFRLPEGSAPIVTVEDADPQHGRTDIRIDCPEYLVCVECKIDAGFQPDQLERYRRIVHERSHGRPGQVAVLQPYDVRQDADVLWGTWNGLGAELRTRCADLDVGNARAAIEDFVTMLEEEMLASVEFSAAHVATLRQSRDALAWVIDELRSVRNHLHSSDEFSKVTSVDVAKNQNIRFRAMRDDADVWVFYSIRMAVFALESLRPSSVTEDDWDRYTDTLLQRGWSQARWRHRRSAVMERVLDPDQLFQQPGVAPRDALHQWIAAGLEHVSHAARK